MLFVSDTALRKAMVSAEASINMEGMYVSDFCKELCEKLLKKEISFEEYTKIVVEGVNSNGI